MASTKYTGVSKDVVMIQLNRLFLLFGYQNATRKRGFDLTKYPKWGIL